MKRCIMLSMTILILQGTALASPPKGSPPDGPPPFFEELDTNHDGRLSREEVEKAPCLPRDFDKLDVNKDGLLDKDELPAPHGPDGRGKGGRSGPPDGHRPPSFEELDADKDGFLTREEISGAPHLARDFETFDADRDGRLSRDELPGPPSGQRPPRRK